MVSLVLRFVASARAAGLRASTSELLDCLSHLERVDLLDESQFRSVLQANFAKSRREQMHFERLYQLFFYERRQHPSIARSVALADPIQAVLQALAPPAGSDLLLQALLDFLGGNPTALLGQVPAAGQRQGGHGGTAAARRLMLAGRIDALEEALTAALAGRRAELGWEERRDLLEHFQDRLDSARQLLEQPPRARADTDRQVRSYRQHLDDLGEIHFASLTPREVEAMREVVEQLVRRLKDKVSRRRAAGRRGPLDVKKTLRRAVACEGVPFEVFYRRRPKRKAKIVVLCDVSGSVWSAARFMLNMLYSLQECFTQVRSFIFVSGVAEVTNVFEDHEINPAIDKILKEADIDYNAATDYGRTFREFRQNYMDILNKKTTLIVIGDGRSNYTDPEVSILEAMRGRSRRLVWLNPETEQFWATGDSEMRALAAVCDTVRPCQNLKQLTDFITSLVL
jgi:uncharacterized protein with von Willebrand factor type A (vWA) domain